jgi:hypothetical protein
MKNCIPLVIAAVIIIVAILFAYLWIPGLFPKENTTTEKPSGNVTPELNNTNTRLRNFPPEIRGEIQTLAGKYSLALNILGFDPINNEINLYAYGIPNESAFSDLQGRQIGNYTIHIINYTEILNARDEVYIQLFQIQKKPEYQIAHISMMEDIFSDPKEYTVELWAYNSTPENKKLDNMVIKGWKIQVYPMSPIPSNTSNSSKSR